MAEPDLLSQSKSAASASSVGSSAGTKNALPEGFSPTPKAWVEVVLADFDSFLQDHASCEKKASGMALNVASHYPDRPKLLAAMADLAVEELTHYREVVKLMATRNLSPAPDRKDPYIHAMNAQIRKGPQQFLLDRLLVGAVVEARGYERFKLVGEHLPDGAEQRFFQAIVASEHRHWQLFVALARSECADVDVDARFAELVAAETEIVQQLPHRAALH